MPDALIVDNEPFLASKAPDIAAAGLPAISGGREFAVAAARRRTGSYIERILKGGQPPDLPFSPPCGVSPPPPTRKLKKPSRSCPVWVECGRPVDELPPTINRTVSSP